MNPNTVKQKQTTKALRDALQQERAKLQDQLRELESALAEPGRAKEVKAPVAEVKTRKRRRRMSAEARARIAEAARERWAKWRVAHKANKK